MGKNKLIDKDRGWRAMVKAVDSMKGGSFVKVGILADDEKGGMHVEGADLTVAEIAVIQEFGTEDGHTPPRSFVRATFDEQREHLRKMGAKFLIEIIGGEMSLGRALGLMGAKLAAEIKKKVTQGEGIPPPNAESTIAAKGSDRPLVDTGRMIGAVTWEVTLGDVSRIVSR